MNTLNLYHFLVNAGSLEKHEAKMTLEVEGFKKNSNIIWKWSLLMLLLMLSKKLQVTNLD